MIENSESSAISTIIVDEGRNDIKPFHVPELPSFPDIIELQSVIPLQTGYDMRTLRKQLEYLHDKVNNCILSQNDVLDQNISLLHYMQELESTNSSNWNSMRKEASFLHLEVSDNIERRNDILSKIDSSKSSKDVITNEWVYLIIII